MELEKQRDRESLVSALMEAGAAGVRGSSLRCPFHEDRTASGHIKQDSSGHWRFTCHTASCGWKGDVYDVEAHNAGMSVKDYLRKLGEHTKAAVERRDRPKPSSVVKEDAPSDKEPTRVFRNPFEIEITVSHCSGCYKYTNPVTHAIEMIVLRIEEPGKKKRFLQMQPCDGGFTWGAPSGPWPLYNRTRIMESDTIIIVEGEKCVHALQDIGIVATTSPGGAGKAFHADWGLLAGKRVILWPDNDAPDPKTGKRAGHEHMNDVRQILSNLDPCPRIGVLDFSAQPEKWDAADCVAEMQREGLDPNEIREVLSTYFDDAKPHGAASELTKYMEDTISGLRTAIQWPWPVFGKSTYALLPGMLMLICGDPGARKSFFLTQSLIKFHRDNVKVGAFMLEHTKNWHMNRTLAQVSGNGALFDPEWIADNPTTVRNLMEKHQDFLNDFGRRVWTSHEAAEEVTYASMLAWTRQRAEQGCRVIAIDPVTMLEGGDRQWQEDLRFIRELKQIAELHGCSIIMVTHPRTTTRKGPSLHDLAGGGAYSRFSQTVCWIESWDDPKQVEIIEYDDIGTTNCYDEIVRVQVRIMKATNGPGTGRKIGYKFEELQFREVGIIRTERRKTKQDSKITNQFFTKPVEPEPVEPQENLF